MGRLANKKILLYCPKANTFVKRDLAMLKRVFGNAELTIVHTENKVQLLKNLIVQFFTQPLKIAKANYVMAWFVGYHSIIPFFFAKLFRKKTVSFLGGTECHNFPEFDYGNYRKPMYAWATRFSLERCDYIFPVHESLIESEVKYTKTTYPKQGILAFNKKLKGHIEELYCGFEQQKKWTVSQKKQNSFLTVSSYLYGMDFVRKGVDMVVEMAKQLPDCTFTIVGDGYKGEELPNLKVISALSYDELIDVYIEHQFYLQLSIAEGFPNALAEAMLYGCIPIGSSVFGIPGMINDTGFIAENKDAEEIKKLIQSIIDMPSDSKTELAQKATQRVLTEYTFEKREQKFRNIVGE